MLNFQAEGVMQELKEDLKKCKSLGILIDESEDSSKTSILLVYVRYWSRNKNKIQTKLLETLELEKKDA